MYTLLDTLTPQPLLQQLLSPPASQGQRCGNGKRRETIVMCSCSVLLQLRSGAGSGSQDPLRQVYCTFCFWAAFQPHIPQPRRPLPPTS